MYLHHLHLMFLGSYPDHVLQLKMLHHHHHHYLGLVSYLSIYLFLHYFPDLQFLNLLVYLHCIQNLHLQKRLLLLTYHILHRHHLSCRLA